MHLPGSLQTRTISLIVAVVVVVLAVSTYFNIRLSEKTSIESLKNKALLVAEQLDKSIRGWEDVKDLGALRRQVRDLVMAQRGITEVAMFISSPKGMELVASSEERSLASLGDQETRTMSDGKTIATLEQGEGGRWWHVSTPIHIGSVIAGAISVRVSLKEADLLASQQRKQAYSIALITVCVLIVPLAWFFRRAILGPISSLIAAMKEAEAGNLAQEVALPGRDEFGIMAENFNRMLRRIRGSTEENLKLLDTINRFNEDLKARVAQATQELAARNDELIRANDLLFEIQRKLSHSEKLATVGQVAAAVAHEVGTPLNSIVGHLQLLAEDSALRVEGRKRIDLIRGQVDRVVGILKNLLSSSRMPASRPAPTDINKIIRELVALTSPGMALKNVTPRMDLDPNLPLIPADSHQIQQVLLNLISNSLDAMPEGGRLTISTSMADSLLRISVKDSGQGIPGTHLKKIFEPFFTTKAEGHGSGLGLAICQQIVKAHGGRIDVDSVLQQGTEFTVLLPASDMRLTQPPPSDIPPRGARA